MLRVITCIHLIIDSFAHIHRIVVVTVAKHPRTHISHTHYRINVHTYTIAHTRAYKSMQKTRINIYAQRHTISGLVSPLSPSPSTLMSLECPAVRCWLRTSCSSSPLPPPAQPVSHGWCPLLPPEENIQNKEL